MSTSNRVVCWFAGLALVAAGCSVDSKKPVEPPTAAVDSNAVVYEYVGEVDVATNRMTIRPANSSEIPANSLATKSWSRVSGGATSSSLTVKTFSQTTTAGPVDTTGVINPFPSSYSCSSGHQCSWVSFGQAAGSTLQLGDMVAVVYNISNGVTLGNGERLPYSTSLYASALPQGSTYLHYPGGGAWNTFRWNATANTYSRMWDFNLNSATSFTFNFQIYATYDRSYSAFTGPTTPSAFVDACDTGISYFGFASGNGRNKGSQPIILDFPFSLYDSRGGQGPATIQTLSFHVDGALTMGDDLGLDGADDDPASVLSNVLPGYVILPYYANLTSAKASGEICYTSLGTTPNRTAVFTWKNLTFEVDPASTATATFSAILHENTDQIDFQYKAVDPPLRSIAATGIKKDASTYQCMLTSAAGCVVDVNAAGVDLHMKQYSIAPNNIPSFTPSAAPNLQAWYRADQGLTYGASPKLQTWGDLSGNGHDATQATASLQPSVVVGDSNLASADGVQFSNTELRTPSWTLPFPYTVYIAFAPKNSWSGGSYNYLLDGLNSTNRTALWINPLITGHTAASVAFFSGNPIYSPEVISTTSPTVMCVVYGASGALYVNDPSAPIITGNTGGQAFGGLTLGRAWNATQVGFYDMRELAVFAGIHSDTDRKNMMNYMGSQLGLKASP